MLSESDLRRLDRGSARVVRLGAFIAFLFGAICLIAVGIGDIWLAGRLADAIHAQLWDVFWMKLDYRQTYSGALIGAAELLSRGMRVIAEGAILLALAFVVRNQAKFYARLLAELRARDT